MFILFSLQPRNILHLFNNFLEIPVNFNLTSPTLISNIPPLHIFIYHDPTPTYKVVRLDQIIQFFRFRVRLNGTARIIYKGILLIKVKLRNIHPIEFFQSFFIPYKGPPYISGNNHRSADKILLYLINLIFEVKIFVF